MFFEAGDDGLFRLDTCFCKMKSTKKDAKEIITEAITLWNSESGRLSKDGKPESVTAFCKRIGVPRTTFRDHIHNLELSFKHGPSPILSVTEENALVALLRVFVTRGIPIGANQMMNYGTKLIRKKSGDVADQLGRGWWEEGIKKLGLNILQRSTLSAWTYQTLLFNHILIY